MTAESRQRVLVVDDEPMLREIVAESLRDAGYSVESAAHGVEALELMRRRPPHAVVLDLMMPRLDGTGFVELMRRNPRLASVPILLVTAAYGAAEAAERLGARACITKPFELDRLIEAVRDLMPEPLHAAVEEPSRLDHPSVAGA
jgi:two-component system chemotaxis response regulator CheY